MGKYLYNVSTGEKIFGDKFFNIIDNFIYKVCGINKDEEMNWKEYVFSIISSKCCYGIYRIYNYLELKDFYFKSK